MSSSSTSKKAKKSIPKSIDCGEQVLGLSIHPTSNIAATGLINGVVQFWNYDNASQKKVKQLSPGSSSSCRVVKYLEDGSRILAGASDGALSLISSTKGKVQWHKPDAHENGLSCVQNITQDVFVSSDEEGEIKLWDTRISTAALSVSSDCHSDYVNCFEYVPEKKVLLSAGGDGRLGVHDLRSSARKLRFNDKSEEQGEDLLSMQIMQGGRKLVVGTLQGVLNFWDWGEWEGTCGRFPGHPDSVQEILKVTDSMILTGSGDGLIRVVQLFPHKLLGVLGDHQDFPIERLAWSNDNQLVVSTSHDNLVRFWDSSWLFEDDSDEDDEEEEEGEKGEKGDEDGADSKVKRKIGNTSKSLSEQVPKRVKPSRAKNNMFFSDL